MRPDLPFKFSENKKLFFKPICWTNDPENLYEKIGMSVKAIREVQENLLHQSLLDSSPANPEFLEHYKIELAETAKFIREKNKKPVMKDEMRYGTETFSARIDAALRKEE